MARMASADQSLLTDELSQLILSDYQQDFNSPFQVNRGTSERRTSRQPDQQELRLPADFDSIVYRIEQRFKHSENQANCLINLTDLAVVGTTLPGDKETVVPVRQSIGMDMESDSERCLVPFQPLSRQSQRPSMLMFSQNRMSHSATAALAAPQYVQAAFHPHGKHREPGPV